MARSVSRSKISRILFPVAISFAVLQCPLSMAAHRWYWVALFRQNRSMDKKEVNFTVALQVLPHILYFLDNNH